MLLFVLLWCWLHPPFDKQEIQCTISERKSGKRKNNATMGQSGNHKKEYIWTFGTLIRFDGLERVDPWMRF